MTIFVQYLVFHDIFHDNYMLLHAYFHFEKIDILTNIYILGNSLRISTNTKISQPESQKIPRV